MNKIIAFIFPVDHLDTQLKQRRASALYGVAGLLLGVFVAAAVFVAIRFAQNNILEPELVEPTALLRVPFGIIGMLVIIVLVRRGMLRAATFLMMALAFTLVIASMTLVPWGLHGALLAPVMVIILAALITNGSVVILTTIIMALLLLGYMQSSPEALNVTAFVVPLETLAIGGFSYLLATGWQRSLTILDTRNEVQRLRMVELSGEITQRVFQRVDLESLLHETVVLIRDRFDDIYHAQIFLLNEPGNRAILRASTGEAGRQLLQRGHYLAVGSQSVIGRATTSNRPILARDTKADTFHRQNDLLPETRTELALPMLAPNGIIGVLDVQSMAPNAFTADDISVLSALANQIAVAIEHANLLIAERRTTETNKALVEQTQHQLEQIQTLNRQLTRQAWSAYVHTKELTPALTVDFGSGAMTPNAEWTPSLTQAVEAGKTVQDISGAGQVIAVPLRVRDQVIGAMEFELDDTGQLNAEQAALAQEVADRLALSLESTRIYEEAQRLAQREAIINEIGSRLQTTAHIESALAVAAQGLQSALNAPHVAIRLGTPAQMNNRGQEVEA